MNEGDKAGQDYWDSAWETLPLPPPWDVASPGLSNYVEKELFAEMSAAFGKLAGERQKRQVIEVGCARSQILPTLAREWRCEVAGADYSETGCKQTAEILRRAGVDGDVYCCDIFDAPIELHDRFDMVISFGLVEHFTDTRKILEALARLLKPGGILFTIIPNMTGVTGGVQRWMNRPVYDTHVPLTASQLGYAHEMSGLDVLSCDYYLSTNFGVVNIDNLQSRNLSWWIKKLILAGLNRFSLAVWWLERKTTKFPVSATFSPYVKCVARKAGKSGK